MGDETITSNGEPDTKEAKDFVDSLNHSAERVQTLWFSFLTFMLYLAIATGTTTHRMLFLEEPLNLPVLNIPLPLLGFYILTPIIFVVFHFYMLFSLVLLARTAKSFEDALERAFPEDGEARETFRMRIENTLFVQLLVGGKLEREGLNAKFLSLMALITLALAPVALLLMIQIKFLPYHSEWITWWHRGLLALDLALVWTLWPGYRSGWGVRSWPKEWPTLGNPRFVETLLQWLLILVFLVGAAATILPSWLLYLVAPNLFLLFFFFFFLLWRDWELDEHVRLSPPVLLNAMALVYAVDLATFPDEGMYLATVGITPINTLDLHMAKI